MSCPYKDSQSIVSNYTPISLLSTISKEFERAVYKHVFNHLHDNNVFTENQSGFWSGFWSHDSTVCQLSYLYHTFCEAIDHSKEIRVLFCDIKVRHFIGYVTKESYLNYTLSVLVQVYLIGLKIICMTVNNVFV